MLRLKIQYHAFRVCPCNKSICKTNPPVTLSIKQALMLLYGMNANYFSEFHKVGIVLKLLVFFRCLQTIFHFIVKDIFSLRKPVEPPLTANEMRLTIVVTSEYKRITINFLNISDYINVWKSLMLSFYVVLCFRAF